MINDNTDERGLYLKAIRKRQGKNLIDLEDAFISKATLSKIERNTGTVTEEKYKYYCKLLNIEYDHLNGLILAEKKKNNRLIDLSYSELLGIENVIILSDAKKGLSMLNKLKNLPGSLLNYVEYLKGKANVHLNKTGLARQYFQRAIKLTKENSKNIKALSYNELGKISYYENDYQTAIDYTRLGIEIFDKKADHNYIHNYLLINNAIYQEKINNIAEVTEIIRELWKKRDSIEEIEVLIILYDLQANVHRRRYSYEEAIKNAKKGIELAKVNGKPKQSVELWTSLGSIYIDMNKLIEAEKCLTIGKALRKGVKDETFFLPVYIKLGQLYMEQGNFEAAEKILQKAIKPKGKKLYMSRHIQALALLGDCLFKQTKISKAIMLYTEAYKLSLKYSLVHQEHGLLRRLTICYDEREPELFRNYLEKFFRLDVTLNSNNEKGGGIHA